ncbi:universal stress protein [Spongiactinospora sp. TRM90649]|uniref:universal stress protein n=1 Tax=Spongiactinospora sp. TRM90649 TaxID=3031114 RepID=UPI0023F6F31E|nr:universal stress protein [Spongiactinospora sp. TRM90649]MDF5757188.1 universal stress protein [Spongiactinospora sp. TRM90649]
MRPEDPSRPVATGYDGSAAGEAALRWAVREAQLRYAPLLIFHAWQVPLPRLASDPPVVAAVRHSAELVLRHGVELAHDMAGRLQVQPRLERGTAAGALLMDAWAAQLVVLGTKAGNGNGDGGPERMRLGSTAVHVSSHDPRPVIVVGPGAVPPRRVVLVGVGEEPCSRAVAFAFEEARLRRCELHAVQTCAAGEETWRETGRRFQRMMAPWCERHPEVQVYTRVDQRPPVEALAAATGGSALVVVGEPAAPSLGAATQAVMHGTSHPVAVVHGTARP